MTRYWIIAPIANSDPDFDRIWALDLSNNEISIGWIELGDFSDLSSDELRARINTVYGSSARTKTFGMLWNFYHELQIGDVVVARRGRRTIAGVGTIAGPAFYSPKKDGRHSNFRSVQWIEQPRNRVLPKIAFGMQTLYEIDEAFYKELIGQQTSLSGELATDSLDNNAEFVLEKYLEDFVVTNFLTIFGGKLALYTDPEEKVSGQQYATDVGTIDILALDTKTKDFVVIELKKGREADKVVGQVLRYMGWVKEELATEGQSVKGLIICREPDPRLSYALKMTSNVDLKYYNISFKLNDSLADAP